MKSPIVKSPIVKTKRFRPTVPEKEEGLEDDVSSFELRERNGRFFEPFGSGANRAGDAELLETWFVVRVLLNEKESAACRTEKRSSSQAEEVMRDSTESGATRSGERRSSLL